MRSGAGMCWRKPFFQCAHWTLPSASIRRICYLFVLWSCGSFLIYRQSTLPKPVSRWRRSAPHLFWTLHWTSKPATPHSWHHTWMFHWKSSSDWFFFAIKVMWTVMWWLQALVTKNTCKWWPNIADVHEALKGKLKSNVHTQSWFCSWSQIRIEPWKQPNFSDCWSKMNWP